MLAVLSTTAQGNARYLSTAVLTCITAREGREGAREMPDILSTAVLTFITAREEGKGRGKC
jgi:hypothetical protein